MRAKIVSDIENFITENRLWWVARSKGYPIDNWEEVLSPRDKLEAYLHWNGILGYTDELIAVFVLVGLIKSEEVSQ